MSKKKYGSKVILIKTDDICEIRITEIFMKAFSETHKTHIDTFIEDMIYEHKLPIKSGNDKGYYIGPVWAIMAIFGIVLSVTIGKDVLINDEIRVLK